MSLFGLFDLSGRSTYNFLFKGGSIRERLGDGLKTEEQRRLQEYTDQSIDDRQREGAAQLIGADPNRQARGVDEQFGSMEGNTEMRLQSGRIDP